MITAASVTTVLFFAKPISGLDQNGDGMSDIWQQKYSVPSADANLDYSGTGLTNRQKSLLGLDPRDPNARFHLDIINDSSNNQLRLQLPTVYGKRYQIDRSNDLQSWGSLNSTIIGTGGMIEIAQPLPSSPTFFRASYASDINADGDGLTLWEEHELGTSDQNADTDADGIPDWWEYKFRLNPLVNDAAADADGDGRTNLQEYQGGTDPTDYYNGILPALTIYAGGDQRGNPGTILPTPISIVVNGNGRRNAPVTVTVTQGLALLAPDNSGNYAGATSLTVRSTVRYPDALGFYVAQVYVYLPATAGNLSIIDATVATGGSVSSAKTTAVAIDPSLVPPTNLLATPTSPTTAEISWTKVSELTSTMVQATLDGGKTWINLGAAGPGINHVTVTGLTPDYPVSFRVFSSNDYTIVTNSFTVPHDTTWVPPPSNGAGGDATSSTTVQPLSQPVIEGESKYFNLGAWGFSGFLNQNTYLTKTAVLTCDPENSVTYIDRIDPITGRQLPRETQTTGSSGCFGFYLGEPNTGERIISNTEKLTESLPGDVDDFGNPVHKTLRLTLSDQNNEARLRENAADKLPPFQGTFGEGIDSAYIYVDDSGYGVSALQYRWKVNADPDLVVTWDVQFRPVDTSVQHNVQRWMTNSETLSSIYLVDPRILNGGANGYYDVFLLMANLAVDGNRDGEISFDDPAVRDADKTTSDRPYRFWLNDDDDAELSYGDGGATFPAESEKVPASRPDYSLHQIVSMRNLEDFARLWMDVGGAQDALSWGIQIGLKWKNVTGAPAINIYPSADGDGKNDYLSDETAAQGQISNPIFNEAVRDKNNKQTVDANSMFIFKSDYWTDFNPKKCFLFEGASEGKGELTVVFLDANGNEIAEGSSVWLDLKNIKKMYQRVDTATAHPWPPDQFEPEPNEANESAIVFVHGWRMSPESAGNFAETMFKRLWQRGFTGRFVAFHWDTWWYDAAGWVPFQVGDAIDAYLAHYNDSEYTAWYAGSALKNCVDNLPFVNKDIVGHSMGNIVVGEALREGMAIKNYALLNAAVPAACYDSDEARIRQTEQYDQTAGPLHFTMWDSESPDNDPDSETRDLAYRGTFQNVNGTLINFYLPNDNATSFAWEINNDQTKPPLLGTRLDTNFEYDRDGAPGFKLYKFHYDPAAETNIVDYRITNKLEAMAFACRTWGKAVGAWGLTQGAIAPGNSVDLSEPVIGSGSKGFDTEHSAEFNFGIQRLTPFYGRLLQALDVNFNQ